MDQSFTQSFNGLNGSENTNGPFYFRMRKNVSFDFLDNLIKLLIDGFSLKFI